MKVFIAKAATAAMAFFTTVGGHMVLNKPIPFNFLHPAGDMVSVEPLSLTSPFPCQGRYDYVEEVTQVTAGANTLVNFTGGGQHGGGSCQFSITYDFPLPVDKSKWKTIYTIIGGCPVDSSAGNLLSLGRDPNLAQRHDSVHCHNDYDKNCIRQFEIPIPKELKNGNAIFGWTWFNNIGRREMYMNCAPISITGGTDDDAFFDRLPNLFVANIPGECMVDITLDGILNIPNPGRRGRVIEPPTEGIQGTCESPPMPNFENTGTNSTASSGAQNNPSSHPSYLPTTFTHLTDTGPPLLFTSAVSISEVPNSVVIATSLTASTLLASATVLGTDTAAETQSDGDFC